MVALGLQPEPPAPPAPPPEELNARLFLDQFRKDALSLFDYAFRTQGEFARAQLFGRKVRFAFHPDDVQRVLVDNVANYYKGTKGYAQLRVFLGNGLVTSEGDFWLRQRRISQPAFARRRIAGFAETMVRCTDDNLTRWPEDGDVDMHDEMMRLTLRIAGLTMLSEDLEGDATAIGGSLTQVLSTFNANIGSIIPYRWHLPTPDNLRSRAARRRLDRIVYDIIGRRRDGAGGDDLLQMLLEAVDEDTGERMDDKQLRDEVMTMFLAGHETTANGLTWLFAMLSEHPDVARRVAEELDEVLGDGPIDPMKTRELPYLDAVIKETLRLRPPVWAAGRKSREADTLHGERVDPGTLVFVSPWVTHRHPDFWENPQGFDPDRWLEERERPRYAYFPFLGGPRQCIGKHFAEMELLIVAAMILRRYRVELQPGTRPEPEAKVTLRPKGGLPVRLRRR